jgi:hypothetical protein
MAQGKSSITLTVTVERMDAVPAGVDVAAGADVAPAGRGWRRRGGCGAGGVGVAPAGTNGSASGGGCGECDAGISGVLWSMVRCAASIVHGGPSSRSGTAPAAGHRADPGLPRWRAIEPIRDCPGGGLPVLRSQRQRPLRHATRPGPARRRGWPGIWWRSTAGPGPRSPSEVTYATIKLTLFSATVTRMGTAPARRNRPPATPSHTRSTSGQT